MANNGLLIDYEWCTGCHSCEIACRNENNIDLDKWGIKVLELGPYELGDGKWEWYNFPMPTSLCNLCTDRTAEGKRPACVHHCLAQCLEYGNLDELNKKAEAKGHKVSIFIP